MTNVVPFNEAKVPAVLRDSIGMDDLSAGAGGQFAVVSFRGKTWRIKYQGEENPILNADGDPQASLEVVIVKGNPNLSKNYYEQAYVEGASEAPTCLSLDGIAPDPSAAKPQSSTCASCPHNVFGSRITPAGKKAKACQDNRRLAVVPAGDIINESLGGPMLLRVPASSLADLATYSKGMKAKGFPYNAIVTRIGFEMDAAFPKLTWKAVRPLTDDEAQQVADLLAGDIVHRVLADNEFHSTKAGSPAEPPPAAKPAPAAKPVVDTDFELPDDPAPAAPAKPVKAAPKKTAAAPKVETKPAPAPAPEAAEEGLDKEIASILEGLDNLD